MEYTGWWGVTEQTSKERKRDRGREKEEVESSGGTKEQNPEGGANDPRYGRAHPHLLSQSQAPPPESRVTSHRHLLRLAEVLDYHLDLANLEKLPFLIPTSCISIVHLFFYYLFTFQNWNTSLLFFLHFSSFFEYFNSIQTIWNISISIRYDQCKKKKERNDLRFAWLYSCIAKDDLFPFLKIYTNIIVISYVRIAILDYRYI